MKFRGMLPDQFLEVEADSEKDAQEKMRAMMLERLQARDGPEHFIVWEES